MCDRGTGHREDLTLVIFMLDGRVHFDGEVVIDAVMSLWLSLHRCKVTSLEVPGATGTMRQARGAKRVRFNR